MDKAGIDGHRFRAACYDLFLVEMATPESETISMTTEISDTHPALARLFSAATSTAADLLRLLTLITADGLPNALAQKAILAVWCRLLGGHNQLAECYYLVVEGAKVHHCLSRLWPTPVRLGRFHASSRVQALSQASGNLLGILHRRSDVNAWQQGAGCSNPDPAAMKSLALSWRSIQREVRRRFRSFPRAHVRIADKLLFEINLIESLYGQADSTRKPSDGGNQAAAGVPRTGREATVGRPALTTMELHIVEVLVNAGHRMTTDQILKALFAQYEGSSAIKQCLSTMVTHGLLNNSKAAKPPGYGLSFDSKQSELTLGSV